MLVILDFRAVRLQSCELVATLAAGLAVAIGRKRYNVSVDFIPKRQAVMRSFCQLVPPERVCAFKMQPSDATCVSLTEALPYVADDPVCHMPAES